MLGVWSFIFELASVAFDPKINLAIDALRLSGNSSIIDLFETCAPNSTDLIGPLINTLNGSVLQNERLTIDAQMKLTFETIDRFFEQNPTLKAECQNEQLGNGLDLHEFMEIGRMFKQSAEVKRLFEGDQSELISELVSYLLNNSQLDEPNDLNTKSMLLEEFVDRLCMFFQNETSVHKRLQFSAELLGEMKENDKMLVKNVPIKEWGTIGDLAKVNAFYAYHGWHGLKNSVKCNQVLGLVKINPTTNSTKLVDSLETALNKWSWSERQNFQMFFDQIQQHTLTDELHAAEKLLRTAKTVRFYETEGSKMEQKLVETKVSDWGTLEELCACVGL